MGILKDVTLATQEAIENVTNSYPVKFTERIIEDIKEYNQDSYVRDLNRYYGYIREITDTLPYPCRLSLFRIGDLSDVRILHDSDVYYDYTPPDVKKKEYIIRDNKDNALYKAELDSPFNKVTIVSTDEKRKALIKRKNIGLLNNGDYIFNINLSGKNIGSVNYYHKVKRFDYKYNDWHIVSPGGLKHINNGDKYSNLGLNVITDISGGIGMILPNTLGMSFGYTVPEIEFPMVVACFLYELLKNDYNIRIFYR